MMHFFITTALKNTANVDAFIEDMNEEVKIAKKIALINRKEKYDSLLVVAKHHRQLRAAARTKAPKAKTKPKWSITVTDIVPPTAEWLPGDEY